jgi:hypothetical protein
MRAATAFISRSSPNSTSRCRAACGEASGQMVDESVAGLRSRAGWTTRRHQRRNAFLAARAGAEVAPGLAGASGSRGQDDASRRRSSVAGKCFRRRVPRPRTSARRQGGRRGAGSVRRDRRSPGSAGLVRTSNTAKSRSMPTARSSRPMARPTARRAAARSGRHHRGRRKMRERAGRWMSALVIEADRRRDAGPQLVDFGDQRSQRPGTLRLKRMTPPGAYSARNARVARSSEGPGIPTMKS